MRILALSGSLRAVSSNTALLGAVRRLAGAVEIQLYGGLGDLPHFNPDLDGEPALPAVADFRSSLRQADGVLVSCPEYAHGVPGMFKNALDWVVASGEFVDKPVALLNASPRATHAQAALIEILTVMSARLVPEASIDVSLLGRAWDEAQIAEDPEIAGNLRAALAAFIQAVPCR